jgi:heparin binding hemagglutinin HbhA
MAINTADIKKALTDSTPLYAVAGAGDLAVAKLREVPSRFSTLKVEPKLVQDRVTGSLNSIQGDVRAFPERARTLPEKAQAFAQVQLGKATEAYEDITGKATETYGDLAKRGKNVVGRIRRQKASQDLKADIETTTAKAKATETTARKAVTSTQRAAKGTATSAAKTAKTAEKATKDAAGKVG